MSESTIQKQIMLALSGNGATVFRNNTGMAWTGEVTRLSDGSVLIKNPRPFHAGLVKGGSDLIGFQPVKITEDMVGTTLGQFVAVEVKDRRGRATQEQLNFIRAVQAAGGAAGVARSPDEALAIIQIPAIP